MILQKHLDRAAAAINITKRNRYGKIAGARSITVRGRSMERQLPMEEPMAPKAAGRIRILQFRITALEFFLQTEDRAKQNCAAVQSTLSRRAYSSTSVCPKLMFQSYSDTLARLDRGAARQVKFP